MKNWDGKLVPTVSVDDVEYILCEHYPDRDSDKPPPKFKLFPEQESVKVNLKMFGEVVTIGGMNATQFPVNSNIATTGHKLQGMTKDNLIVQSWNYSFENWVYVVLSRVQTLSGLYLCQKLDTTKSFPCDERLVKEEERLEQLERKMLETLQFTHWE